MVVEDQGCSLLQRGKRWCGDEPLGGARQVPAYGIDVRGVHAEELLVCVQPPHNREGDAADRVCMEWGFSVPRGGGSDRAAQGGCCGPQRHHEGVRGWQVGRGVVQVPCEREVGGSRCPETEFGVELVQGLRQSSARPGAKTLVRTMCTSQRWYSCVWRSLGRPCVGRRASSGSRACVRAHLARRREKASRPVPSGRRPSAHQPGVPRPWCAGAQRRRDRSRRPQGRRSRAARCGRQQ